MFSSTTTLLALAGCVSSTILWDGRLNGQTTSAFLNDWSFSNEVGPYQYYIHGTGKTSEYVKLGKDYKNPADSGSKQGIQITIDSTSVWNNDGMLRTELIPQTTAAINKGRVYYHFSVQHTGTNPPSPHEEHHVCFFESAFTQLSYGLLDGEAGTSDPSIRWMANSQSHWNVTFKPNVWHNMAYAIDFDANTVAFYHSTGADPLKETVAPVSVSASSNGADWHVGVLRLPSQNGATDTAAEDWHFSGVYIEKGDLTTSVAGPGGKVVTSTVKPASTKKPVSTHKATSTAKHTSSKKPTSTKKPATATTKKATVTKHTSAKPTTLKTSVRKTASV